MSSESEALQLRATRAKSRAILKRDGYVAIIRSTHSLAIRTSAEPELAQQLIASVDQLDDIWTAFCVEDDAVLDGCVDLNTLTDYSNQIKVDAWEMITYSKAAANNYREYAPEPSIVSEHGHSRSSLHGSTTEEQQRELYQPPPSNQPVPPVSEPATYNGNAASYNGNGSKPARLPEIPLPTFHGDIYKWLAFRDRFMSMVDQRPNLPDIDKFYYLIGCLKNTALDAVRGIPVSGENYRLAWDTLKSRFDRPRLVAFSLIEKLLNAPKAHTESIDDLNKFLVTFDESVAVLNSMHIPNLGDFVLFSLASRCLPAQVVKLFEARLANGFPTVKELLDFVKTRITILECVPRDMAPKSIKSGQPAKHQAYNRSGFNRFSMPQQSSLLTNSNQSQQSSPTCKCCKGAHVVPSCPKFKGWSTMVRDTWVRENHLCFRCLRPGHRVPACRSSIVCEQCPRRHHPLLHQDINKGSPSDGIPGPSHTRSEATSLIGNLNSQSVLLGTSLVHIRDGAGALHTVRAIVDSASQISAITSACASRLGLHLSKWTAPVSGLSGATVHGVQGLVNCQVQPRFASEPVFDFTACVFPSITADMPRHPIHNDIVDRYKHLALADPTFSSPGPVELLMGADLFSKVLNGKRVSVGESCPVAFGTVFGFVIIGPVPQTVNPVSNIGIVSLATSIETLMGKFWQIEEPEPAPEEFTNDGQCESMFRSGCTRIDSGRYMVPLLFRQHTVEFPGSRAVAKKRFEHLERKLMADQRLRELYCQFMAEYISLGHMSPATSDGCYFIPHHAVYRPADIEPKIRVVFDASAKCYSGISLNDTLFPGPKLQRDVVDVLTLFRVFRHAFTCDISKMYRQILVSPTHQRFQHVLWRSSPHEELMAYELKTVTYGVNCAPYLAIRVLHQIANSACNEVPAVREALLYHTYVDDICAGADDEVSAVRLQSDLINILLASGMELKKWASNTKSLLDNIPGEDRACGSLSFDDGDGIGSKVLGLCWNHRSDSFNYVLKLESLVATKRGMLSLIARIFDPLGLLAPVIFMAKQLMQRVWKANMSWDEVLPPEIRIPWQQFVTDLPILQQISIPRFLHTRRNIQCILCGFCDASELGYAAVVYLKVVNSETSFISLLGAKTKLAPLKASTIPRMELCAALLLARWMARLKRILTGRLHIMNTFAWSDSTIVLNWLKTPHESFKIFVSNRIHQIHTVLPECRWGYVASNENPADSASRGLSPSQLIDHKLYWHGPDWLCSNNDSFDVDIPHLTSDQLPEIKPMKPVALAVQHEAEWYCRFSSYINMIRVIARMRRFINRCRRQVVQDQFLSREELDQASCIVARASQLHDFQILFDELARNVTVSSKPVARLRPFVNNRGLICVGGRLSRSDLPEGQKHPILLSKTSHLALLLVRHWHHVTGHGGPRIVTSLINRQYWILSVNRVIRTVISKCTICVRITSVNPQPVMADLPSSRVVECSPFSRVGIDFAGPLNMKEQCLRKSRQYKVYVAVFVCFVIKAVHLEYVSDLSTEAFLAALKRFVARRGMPTDIYSDCGTNFVGAANHLRQLTNDADCRERLTNAIPCVWHFNPPRAPHFGGLWEAAVRSAKALMVKIMGEHTYTLEEFNTILCRVEAILNSRPLVPTSPDPTEIDILTPGHFLVGRPLLAVPEAVIPVSARPMAQRWKLLNQNVQSFWRRWRRDYLQTLQTRSRWVTDAPNIAVGDLVVVKDLQTPPLQWCMARVTEVVPGRDGVVRVVHLRTATGTMTRPVVKVVKLPTE